MQSGHFEHAIPCVGIISCTYARANDVISVNIRIASVVSHLPSTDDNSAPFTGTTLAWQPTQSNLPQAQDCALKLKQTALQIADAENRNVVWGAEELGDEDAEGEDDDDYIRRPDGTGYDPKPGISFVGDDSGVALMEPIGMRNEHGGIDPMPAAPSDAEIEIEGVSEGVPRCVGDMVCNYFFPNLETRLTPVNIIEEGKEL